MAAWMPLPVKKVSSPPPLQTEKEPATAASAALSQAEFALKGLMGALTPKR
jgi:hypothetical protein